MEKNVIIFGATGNAGGQLLDQSLLDNRISKVTIISRKESGIEHEKLHEIIHRDFLDFSAVEDTFKEPDVCFYCVGVSQLQVNKEDEYKKITHDYTIAVAEILLKNNKEVTFCFLSGEGADPSMKNKTLFARVKGMTENSLKNLPFTKLYIFRPGYIHPVNLRRKKNLMERISTVLYPLMKIIAPNIVTTSEILAKTMIHVSLNGYEKQLIVNKDINNINMNENL
ncbi:MAG: NAD-dependent epimerase/dehydratase family protein [Thermodesulfobacteriota bacterium]|nr:NAD-dependent epimerase/dehydratase family protein [Thermodesulfobacteriota bacterium]